ncbi:MAG: sugar ABC transporter permease [Anaerolineae bacterium]|nr:sugar ABC transporter permease [Anaerolineae bacterium]
MVAYLFVLPYILVMVAFGLGPGLYALLISFADFSLGVPKYFAAGLGNYLAVFKDFRFTFTLGNIGTFLVISVPLGIAMVVILAILLQMRPGKLTTALRTLYFVAGAVTGPVLVLVAIFMLDPSISPFQALLKGMGFQLTNDVIYAGSLPIIFTLIGFFSGAGLWIAIQYGALEAIPTEVLEAATVDGCNAWQKALLIKFPIIRPYIIYQFILIFAGNVQLFVEPQILGGGNNLGVGGNVPAVWSPNQLAYNFAFEMGNFGAASALSLILLAVGLGAAYLIIRWTGFFNIEN